MKPNINAIIIHADGTEIALPQDASLVLTYPDGNTVEVTWQPNHPRDPRPISAQIWGGRQQDGEQKAPSCPVVVIPSAANLLLVSPFVTNNKTEL